LSNDKLKTVNPATEEIILEYEIMTRDQINDSVKKARYAFQNGWKSNIKKRAEFIYDFSHELKENKEKLAKTATNEMGKPIKEARSEVDKCVWVMEYFADKGPIFASDEIINTDARKTIITFEPIGVIGSIMPWNFPYWQALRFAAPSLMVGNTVVLKPASATMQCGLEIEAAFNNVGLPDGIFQTLTGNSSVAESLIDSNGVNAVTFTGSVSVGSKVAQRAAAQVKKCVLELGGSDPFIVCRDADIEKASTGAVKGRFINCGQSCIASKRFFVVKEVADEFIERFVQKVEQLRVGDPLADDTDIGPLVNANGLENVAALVKEATMDSAEVITGGEQIKSNGYFYKPTIITKISPKMRIAREETFGPVAPVTIVENEVAAMNLANDSQYGLGASIWTSDLDRADKLARRIESGIVTINNVVVSDPRVPFGGVKKSGFGRELSRYGMLEFVNIKSIRYYDELIHNHYVE
jgi:acyl-CoA reductase-like NAD-dependent aldehyde dehydrogenase